MERQISISFDGINSDTPPNEKLSAKYVKSFAYYTVKDRLPITLTKVINDLVINKEKIIKVMNKQACYCKINKILFYHSFETESETGEDLKSVIGKISKLKNELVTNKVFVRLNSKGDDVQEWNDYLDSETKSQSDIPCWYYTTWLYAECYMYRRLWETFENSNTLTGLDPFATVKEEALQQALPTIKAIAKEIVFKLEEIEKSQECVDALFVEYLKLSLWSNRCDLSLTSGQQVSEKNHNFLNVNSLDLFILSDDSLAVFKYLKQNPGGVIDFVSDNSAFETFSDFCLCDLLCTSSLASKIRFHVKKLPWFVSDVTQNDIDFMFEVMKKEGMMDLIKRWKAYLENGTWSVSKEKFWTLPFDFNEMRVRNSELYSSLRESSLIIFKGDLNYRKLLGDINWKPSEPFDVALRHFKPASILSLRTVKSDLICGLPPGKFEQLSEKNKMWMRTGEYAVIQFCKT